MRTAWNLLNRSVAWTLLLAVGCLASMSIGYFVFSHFAGQLLAPPVHEEGLIEEGRALRLHANALVVLLSGFHNASRGDAERFEIWLDEVFKPGTARVQRSIRAQRHHGSAQAGLIAAANHLVSLGERPHDAPRRDEATRRVLDAAAAAEERIGELGVAPYLDEPAQLLQFRLYGQ